MLCNQHVFTRRPLLGLLHRYTLETFSCTGITFQRKMTPKIGIVTAFLTYLEHRSRTAFFMIIIHHELIMFFNGLVVWYAPSDLSRSFCERKVLHFHRNSSRHPFSQMNSKNITVKPMNVKEFDDFFRRPIGHFPVFRPNSVQNCGFRFSVQNAKLRDSVRFPSKTISFSPYCWVITLSKLFTLMVLSPTQPSIPLG